MSIIKTTKIETKVGDLRFFIEGDKVILLKFDNDRFIDPYIFLNKYIRKYTIKEDDSRTILEYKNQIEKYFDGKLEKFDIPYTIYGSEYKERVLNAVSKIPYGNLVSYKDIGILSESKSFRAVGGALKRNPLPIIIPCHRVISSKGTIGGFSMGKGINTKKVLIELEQNNRK